MNAACDEKAVSFIQNAAVEIFYDNSKKFETTPTGSVVTGIHTATVALHAGTTITADAGTGIITATEFKGSGANLTGLPAGFDWLQGSLF